ncbi:hypothetical protein KC331_g3969 [Hortaea werneckii]|nr:hypothetical protein KC324_g5887 [Hortaea werneckii]KAI7549155.1 hypothetical protein KC331_g3969 [Hortaea werneckii]KAI7585975.1 hypothetical protein KC316_g5865 [Hortaea werneckii]KAI7717068.1 hypothetical protein KC353_g4884 [Hortaea werneckii]
MQFTALAVLLASGLASAGTAAIPNPNCNIFSDIPASAVGVKNIVNFLQSIPDTSAYADPSSGGGTACSYISAGTPDNRNACAYLCSRNGQTTHLSYGKASDYISVILNDCDVDNDGRLNGNIAGDEGTGQFNIDVHECTA